MKIRGAVVLVDEDRVCLIERVRAGRTYYLFPGGGAEAGESPEQAAVREAYEELGLHVELERLVGDFSHRGERHLFYTARVTGGEFGTGMGEEMACTADSVSGSYTPVWLPLASALQRDVRPRELCEALRSGALQGAAIITGPAADGSPVTDGGVLFDRIAGEPRA